MSFLTNSPHIARRVEGGLRQEVGDAGHTSAMMHLPSGTQARPVDLTLQILKRRRRKSEGGQIVQELNSVREGKYRDDAKGGWLDPILVRKAREEEMQHVKKHVVYEKVPTSQCWKESGKNPHQDRLGGDEQGNVRVTEHKISMGREAIQHWTQARLVQRNITSGGS